MPVKRLTWFLCLLAAPLFGAEGMWMPQQIPQLGPELQKLGLKIDPQRFADLTGDPMGAVDLARRLQRLVRLPRRPRRHEPSLRLRRAAVQLHAAARPHHQRLPGQDARGGAAGRPRLARLRHHEDRGRHRRA